MSNTRWSKLKKQIEGNFAETIIGRVELFMTGYHKTHNEAGRWAIRVDGKEIFKTDDWKSWKYKYHTEDKLENNVQEKGLHERDDLLQSLREYLALSIDKAMESPDIVIKSLAILDRRVGKRKLTNMNIKDTEHALIKQCAKLRLESEGIQISCGFLTSQSS